MEEIRTWLTRLIGTALIGAAAVMLTPEGKGKRITRLCCGLASILALLSAVSEISVGGFSLEYGDIPAVTRQEAATETRFIIEARIAEYIEERAAELGLRVDAAVTAQWAEEGFWLPRSVRLSGEAGEAEKLRLRAVIEEEVGIAGEDQHWSG